MAEAPNPQPTPAATRAQQLVDKLWARKDAVGVEFRKSAKEMFPDINTPDEQMEIAAAPIVEKVGKLEGQLKDALDRISAREKADDDLKAENDLGAKIYKAASTFGLTDQGRDKMMARMKETGNVADPEAAAAWVVSQMPKPQASNTPSWLPQKADLFGVTERDEKWASLHRDPLKYFDNELRECFNDPQKYVAETFGTA
jgi:hypothetical protein